MSQRGSRKRSKSACGSSSSSSAIPSGSQADRDGIGARSSSSATGSGFHSRARKAGAGAQAVVDGDGIEARFVRFKEMLEKSDPDALNAGFRLIQEFGLEVLKMQFEKATEKCNAELKPKLSTQTKTILYAVVHSLIANVQADYSSALYLKFRDFTKGLLQTMLQTFREQFPSAQDGETHDHIDASALYVDSRLDALLGFNRIWDMYSYVLKELSILFSPIDKGFVANNKSGLAPQYLDRNDPKAMERAYECVHSLTVASVHDFYSIFYGGSKKDILDKFFQALDRSRKLSESTTAARRDVRAYKCCVHVILMCTSLEVVLLMLFNMSISCEIALHTYLPCL